MAECEFCNSSFKSKYSLKTHLNNNKACLKNRGLELCSKFKCNGCNIILTLKSHLNFHQETCKEFIKYEMNQTIMDLKSKLSIKEEQFDMEIKKHKELIENEFEFKKQEFEKQYETKITDMKFNFEKTIKDLQIQNEKLIDSLQKLASQAIDKPTNVTNIKNSFSDKYFLETIVTEDVKRKFQNYLTEEVFLEGQRGIAQLCTEHIIKTKDNKALMVCTDTSRKKFKYMDENGNMKEDFEARTFTEKVSKPIKDVSKIVYENILSDVKSEKELVEDTNYSRKAYLNDKELKTIDCFVKINCFDHPDHNTEFKNELAILNK